jgi:hypothetical protein
VYRKTAARTTTTAKLAAARPLQAVHVGGGGFTMPGWPAATRPGSTSAVSEVDAGVVELGHRELAGEGGWTPTPGSTSASATRTLARDAAVLTDDRAPVDQLLS